MSSALVRLTQALAVLLMLLAVPLQAGPIFLPGKLEDGKFVPTAAASQGYCVRYSSASVSVEDDKATVQVEDTIDVHDKEFQGVCLIPLPAGATGSDIRVTLGAPGARPTILGDAVFLSSAKAQDVLEAVARGTGSNKLLKVLVTRDDYHIQTLSNALSHERSNYIVRLKAR